MDSVMQIGIVLQEPYNCKKHKNLSLNFDMTVRAGEDSTIVGKVQRDYRINALDAISSGWQELQCIYNHSEKFIVVAATGRQVKRRRDTEEVKVQESNYIQPPSPRNSKSFRCQQCFTFRESSGACSFCGSRFHFEYTNKM